MLGKVTKFEREVKIEWTKVSRPTKKELVGSSILVIFSTAILASYIGGVDLIFAKIFELLLK